MHKLPKSRWTARVIHLALLAATVGDGPRVASAAPHAAARPGVIEAEARSEYSHIRVRRQGSIKTMTFIRDTGEEVIETEMNVAKPHELIEPYVRHMFASYLLCPHPERVLIVGLGGGTMVHFLQHYDPQLKVDVVEIDEAVVRLAQQHFGVRPTENVRLFTADGFAYLQKTEWRYDVIYLDAFLKPAPDTDATGVPLRLKTEQFYQTLGTRLTPAGIVVFNLNRSKSTDADLRTIRTAFRQTYVFRVNAGNTIAIASLAEAREPLSALSAHARETDHRLKASFSFQDLLSHLAR